MHTSSASTFPERQQISCRNPPHQAWRWAPVRPRDQALPHPARGMMLCFSKVLGMKASCVGSADGHTHQSIWLWNPLVALSWTWMSHTSYPGDHCPRFVLLIQTFSRRRDLLSWSVMKLLLRTSVGSEGGSVPGAHTPAGRAGCELGCARASLSRCPGAHSKAQPGFISTGVRLGRPCPQAEPALFNCVRKHSLSRFYRQKQRCKIKQ